LDGQIATASVGTEGFGVGIDTEAAVPESGNALYARLRVNRRTPAPTISSTSPPATSNARSSPVNGSVPWDAAPRVPPEPTPDCVSPAVPRYPAPDVDPDWARTAGASNSPAKAAANKL
jgi:hypothetical protein